MSGLANADGSTKGINAHARTSASSLSSTPVGPGSLRRRKLSAAASPAPSANNAITPVVSAESMHDMNEGLRTALLSGKLLATHSHHSLNSAPWPNPAPFVSQPLPPYQMHASSPPVSTSASSSSSSSLHQLPPHMRHRQPAASVLSAGTLLYILTAFITLLAALAAMHITGYELVHKESQLHAFPYLTAASRCVLSCLKSPLDVCSNRINPTPYINPGTFSTTPSIFATTVSSSNNNNNNAIIAQAQSAMNNELLSDAGSATTGSTIAAINSIQTTEVITSTPMVPEEPPKDPRERSVRFVNNANYTVDVFWVNATGGEQFVVTLKLNDNVAWKSFKDHVFVFRNKEDGTFMRSQIVGDKHFTMRTVLDGTSMFHINYEDRTGRAWMNIHPRPPLVHPVWTPEAMHGQSILKVSTTAPLMHSLPQTNEELIGTSEHELVAVASDPRIIYIDKFLTDFECNHLINIAVRSGKLKRSGVEHVGEVHAARTSTSTFITYDNSTFYRTLYRRGFELLRIPADTHNYTIIAEDLQILHYGNKQEYKAHHDWFDPFKSTYKDVEHISSGRNRYATLFLYLNEVEQGGETAFPRRNNILIENACADPRGFKVKPKKGAAVLFYSMLPDGNVDDNSLHAGCPVIKGEKWAANWWFWDPYRLNKK